MKFVLAQVIVLCLVDLGASYPGRMNSLDQLSGTDSRRDSDSTMLCSFVSSHGKRTLKEQLLHIILLVFIQCYPSAIHPLTAVGACSAVSFLLPVNCYHEHCTDISGVLMTVSSYDGLTQYEVTMAKTSTSEWWNLQVNLSLGILGAM